MVKRTGQYQVCNGKRELVNIKCVMVKRTGQYQVCNGKENWSISSV